MCGEKSDAAHHPGILNTHGDSNIVLWGAFLYQGNEIWSDLLGRYRAVQEENLRKSGRHQKEAEVHLQAEQPH